MLVPQASTPQIQNIYRRDAELMVWWATEIECTSALARLERRNEITTRGASMAFRRLDVMKSSWSEVQSLGPIKEISRRLLRTHDLRAGDAMQLAAAVVASEGRPSSLEFLSLDDRLVQAAHREGLVVVDAQTE